jgi:hypothetical protein
MYRGSPSTPAVNSQKHATRSKTVQMIMSAVGTLTKGSAYRYKNVVAYFVRDVAEFACHAALDSERNDLHSGYNQRYSPICP